MIPPVADGNDSIGSTSQREDNLEIESFAQRLRASLPAGLVLDNPGGGTSTIMWCDGERICYRRGGSRIYVRVGDLHAAYLRYAGEDLPARDLKLHAPHVFDSARKGHNCNCSFFFLALQRMDLAGKICGRGQKGSLFGVTIQPRNE